MFDRIVTSTNEDLMYLGFWRIQILAHKKFFPNKILTIAFLTNRDEDDDLIIEMRNNGVDVKLYKPIPNIPKGNQGKLLRYVCASEFESEVSVITDMDTIPLQSDYLNEITSKREKNKVLCVGSEVYHNTPHSGKFPAHHMTAEGSLFKKLFNPNNLPYDELINEISKINNVFDSKESLHSDIFSDESLIRVLFNNSSVERQNYPRNINIKQQWIDRSWWGIDNDRLENFEYIEANLLRPYSDHRNDILPIEVFLNKLHNTNSKFETSFLKNYFSVAEKSLELYGGNIIEIGAGHGESTKKLLQIAKNYNSKVIVIDPFEDGWDEMPETYGKPYPYEIFKSNVSNYEKNIVLLKKSSLEENIYDDIVNHSPISFSFVDGLQYKEAVLSDLRLMRKLNCKVICVDDYTRNTNESQVPLAIDEFLTIFNDYEILYSENIPVRAKIYLIKKHI
jgi:hypothetical protein